MGKEKVHHGYYIIGARGAWFALMVRQIHDGSGLAARLVTDEEGNLDRFGPYSTQEQAKAKGEAERSIRGR